MIITLVGTLLIANNSFGSRGGVDCEIPRHYDESVNTVEASSVEICARKILNNQTLLDKVESTTKVAEEIAADPLSQESGLRERAVVASANLTLRFYKPLSKAIEILKNQGTLTRFQEEVIETLCDAGLDLKRAQSEYLSEDSASSDYIKMAACQRRNVPGCEIGN